jgi:hypothetical protein
MLAGPIERATGQVVHLNFDVARCNTCGEAPHPTAALFDQLIRANQRERRRTDPWARCHNQDHGPNGTWDRYLGQNPATIELKRPVRYTGRGPSRLGNRGAEPTLLPLPRCLRALEKSL